MTEQKLANLISYSVIKLPKSLPVVVLKNSGQLFELAKKLLAKCEEEAIILQGDCPLPFALVLYMRAKGAFEDIVWQPTPEKSGLIIYSNYDSEEFFHPQFVQKPIDWTSKEIKTLQTKRKKDQKSEITIDLTKAWQKVKAGKNQLKEFLSLIYGLEPKKQSVVLKGKCPLGPALLVCQWFFIKADSLFYENIKIR